MSIFEEIQHKKNFSKTENFILQFIIQNQDRMEKMTIGELARMTYSSNTSIIRICHKLGFSGYREFKIAFIRELENQKLVTNTIDYSYPFQLNESDAVIVKNMYSLFKESVDMVQSKLDIQVLGNMVRVMEKSKRIFMFGVGDTKVTIKSFINKAAKINLFPVLATENGEEHYICQNMEVNDCVMFITYGGHHDRFDGYVKYLRKKKVKILVLTANPECYLAQNNDLCICIPDLEKEAKIATYYSQIVFQYILNLMFSLLYRDFARKNSKNTLNCT